MNETGLQDLMTQDLQDVKPTTTSQATKPKVKRKRRKKKTAEWMQGKTRRAFFITDTSYNEASKQIKARTTPHDSVSQLMDELLTNWTNGLYEDAHKDLPNWAEHYD